MTSALCNKNQKPKIRTHLQVESKLSPPWFQHYKNETPCWIISSCLRLDFQIIDGNSRLNHFNLLPPRFQYHKKEFQVEPDQVVFWIGSTTIKNKIIRLRTRTFIKIFISISRGCHVTWYCFPSVLHFWHISKAELPKLWPITSRFKCTAAFMKVSLISPLERLGQSNDLVRFHNQESNQSAINTLKQIVSSYISSPHWGHLEKSEGTSATSWNTKHN